MKFDDLRPYVDEEIQPAMKRIIANDLFPRLVEFVYPGRKSEEIKRLLESITTVYDFQHSVMRAMSEQIMKRSIDHFTYSGVKELKQGRNYLFVSNHRDIVLDSDLLQYALFLEGFPTTEITFGSNLMFSQLVIDVGRANKMFKVVRGGNPREFYQNSIHLSEYIRYALTQKGESVWIAQRNGRTKNGIDQTDSGIMNMFSMSRRDDLVQSFSELHIVPMTISYQWEPCDLFKAMELYRSKDKPYVKMPDEDLNSVLTGIMQSKGNVHVSLGQEITEKSLMPLAELNRNEFVKQVTAEVDRQIIADYHYMDNNYIAADLLHENKVYAAHYSPESCNCFIDYLAKKLDSITEGKEQIQQLILKIYAGRL
jgi:hypothetical protein